MEKLLQDRLNRRIFLEKSVTGLGSIALGSMLKPFGKSPGGVPKAKRVIFLFQAGGPSQMDLFDYKPTLDKWHKLEIPNSIRGDQRVSGMTAFQTRFPIAKSLFSFDQYGQSGAWVSDLLPYTSKVVDDICFIKSMNTNAINHDPGITFLQSGSEQRGRPCIGSWVSYGLGNSNSNLPAFVVLISRSHRIQTTLPSTLWSSGFLPSHHQGVQFRSAEDAVLYLSNPKGIDRKSRRQALDFINELNLQELAQSGDSEINAKIEQYEMAYRMQTSVPDALDISKEPDHVLDLYGPDVKVAGSYASNCLKARKLAENDVRFIQLYHMGWDHHNDLPERMRDLCKQTDQATAGLIQDLKQRGLLDDTLIVWGGEFGRTAFSQGSISEFNYGRDHHPRCFTMWMAGAGVKGGFSYGETDDFGYNIMKDPVHVHDLHATILHLMGFDHEKLTYRHQGRRYRLTDVHGLVVKDILA